MGSTEAGLLVFIEEPARIASRWSTPTIPPETAGGILAAAHRDSVANLGAMIDATLYVAPQAPEDDPYVRDLGRRAGVEVLELPEAAGLALWDSALSILYNRCRHPKVLCANGQVPDLYPDDLTRAARKLDLYETVVGREGEEGCWLIGMHGYTDFLAQVQPRGDGWLHALLEAGAERGQQISVLDTKTSVRAGLDLDELRFLARRDQHPELRRSLDAAGLLLPSPEPGA